MNAIFGLMVCNIFNFLIVKQSCFLEKIVRPSREGVFDSELLDMKYKTISVNTTPVRIPEKNFMINSFLVKLRLSIKIM